MGWPGEGAACVCQLTAVQVTSNSVCCHAQINQVIGIDLLSQSLMPAIETLADDNHWRVRLAIIKYIPLLATQLGADVFQQQLGQQCMRWLEDQVSLQLMMLMLMVMHAAQQYTECQGKTFGCCFKVFCIREAATQNLQKLASEFGPDWAKENLVPPVSRHWLS